MMHLLERAPHTDTHTKLVSQSWWLHVWYSKLHLFTKHGYYTCTHTCTRAFVSSSRSKLWQSAGVWPLFYISRTLCCVQHSSWHITRLSYPSPCSAIHLAYWGSVALRKCCFDMKTPGVFSKFGEWKYSAADCLLNTWAQFIFHWFFSW